MRKKCKTEVSRFVQALFPGKWWKKSKVLHFFFSFTDIILDNDWFFLWIYDEYFSLTKLDNVAKLRNWLGEHASITHMYSHFICVLEPICVLVWNVLLLWVGSLSMSMVLMRRSSSCSRALARESHGELGRDPSQVDNVFSRAAKHMQPALSGQRQSHQDRSGWWTTNGQRNYMFNYAALQLAV